MCKLRLPFSAMFLCACLSGCSGCADGSAQETVSANGRDVLDDPFQDKDQPQPNEVEIDLPTITLNDDGTVVVEGEPETYKAARGDQLNVSGVIHQPSAEHPNAVAVAIVHYQPDGKSIICNSGTTIAEDLGGNRYRFSLPIEMRAPKQWNNLRIQVHYGRDMILKRDLKAK